MEYPVKRFDLTECDQETVNFVVGKMEAEELFTMTFMCPQGFIETIQVVKYDFGHPITQHGERIIIRASEGAFDEAGVGDQASGVIESNNGLCQVLVTDSVSEVSSPITCNIPEKA
jgi:hypothetical protein